MEQNKTKKGSIVVIIILFLIILALGGYIAFDKLVLNKKEEKVTTTVKDIEIDLNAMYQVSNTLNQLDNTFNDINSKYLGYIYVKDKLELKKFDSTAALFLALHDNLKATGTQQEVFSQQIKNNYESIFGQSSKYEPTNIDAGDYYKILYDAASNKYLYTLNPIIINQNNGYVACNIKTILESDGIIVTRKVFYKEYDATMTSVSIYKDSSKTQLLGTLQLRNGFLNNKEVIAKYGSKIDTYQYTFKQNTIDNYTFSKIQKIKK